ncbi:MAG TPA: MFS transporter [Casimicrobiaceae bacterium]
MRVAARARALPGLNRLSLMLKDIIRRYRAFLRLPDVARLLATAFLSRLPIGSLSLAMLMHVRALTGSFALAGLTVGVDLAASAIIAPALGRIIDRRGPRSVLLATGIVCPMALLCILLADRLALPTAGLIAAAAIAGAFAPPITVLTRTVWRYRFDDLNERRTAFALDAVLIEMAFTLGPLLVAALLAVASPRVAFAAAWSLVTLAVPVFALSPALKYWRHQPGAERRLLGPLSEPRLLVAFGVTFLVMFALGLLEIGYAGFATAAAMPAFAGVLIAINSLGSGASGLVYGGLQPATPIERQLPWLLLLLAVPLVGHALTTSPWLLATLALVAGIGIAPSLTVVMLLVSANAPSRYATEAFTWSTTFLVGGLGAGNAVGGRIVEIHGARTVFAVAAGVAAVAAICALGVRQRTRGPILYRS